MWHIRLLLWNTAESGCRGDDDDRKEMAMIFDDCIMMTMPCDDRIKMTMISDDCLKMT